MKITLPENIGDITLRQFLLYDALDEKDDATFLKKKIEIFTGIPFEALDGIDLKDAEDITKQIDSALGKDAEFVNRFTLHGIEYGFIPDFDKISFGEFVDMSKYGVEKETLPNLMAILFRPIVEKAGDRYSILEYQGTKDYVTLMYDVPLNIVNGALVFFYNLANELSKVTPKYLTEELAREQKQRTISRISVGIQRLKNWLITIFSK